MSETDPLIDNYGRGDDNNDDDDDDDNNNDESSRATLNRYTYDETPGPSWERQGGHRGERSRAHQDEQIGMTTFKGGDVGNKLADLKIQLAKLTLKQMYPKYSKNGRFLTLVIDDDGRFKNKVVVVGPRGGKTPLFTSKG